MRRQRKGPERRRNRWHLTLLGIVALCPLSLAAEEAQTGPDTRYVEMKPTFVTNFGPTTTPRLMYIKTDVALRVDGEAGEDAAEYHLPALRDAVVMLLSRQSEAAVVTGEAREHVRAEALGMLQELLQQEEGEPYIQDLLFTNFIVQR